LVSNNDGGIDVTLDEDTNYKTKDKDINLNTGNGKVNIGDADLESLVRGETLVDLRINFSQTFYWFALYHLKF